MTDRDPVDLARAYYRALDGSDYGDLADLLAPDFVQVRGDRTLEGRETFVQFMRDERPERDTTHEVDAVYRLIDDPPADESGPVGVAVRGRLHRADGAVWFGFVDVFAVVAGRLVRLITYTNDRVS